MKINHIRWYTSSRLRQITYGNEFRMFDRYLAALISRLLEKVPNKVTLWIHSVISSSSGWFIEYCADEIFMISYCDLELTFMSRQRGEKTFTWRSSPSTYSFSFWHLPIGVPVLLLVSLFMKFRAEKKSFHLFVFGSVQDETRIVIDKFLIQFSAFLTISTASCCVVALFVCSFFLLAVSHNEEWEIDD